MGTLNLNTTGVTAAFLLLLTGNAAVTTVLGSGQRVWFGVAPAGAKSPFAVVYVASDLRARFVHAGCIQDIIYAIKVASYGNNAYSVSSLAMDTIDAALDDALLSPLPAGYTKCLSIQRDGSGTQFADSDGFYNHVYYYKVTLQQ